jgi:hypothetical protein
MKFEIDLADVLTDEYGNGETLADTVRRQVIDKLTAEVSKGVRAQIDTEVARVLNEELQTAVKDKLPALMDDLMNTEYYSVDRWGDRAKQPTTFRNELVKAIMSNMDYKYQRYDSDKNVFTKAVDAVVSENVKVMQKEFDKKVIELFQKEAFDYAMKQMAAKLQVTLT